MKAADDIAASWQDVINFCVESTVLATLVAPSSSHLAVTVQMMIELHGQDAAQRHVTIGVHVGMWHQTRVL